MVLGGGQGGLAPALGASLALHLLLLWPDAMTGPLQQAGTTLSATLRAPVASVQPLVPASMATPQPRPPAGRQPAERPPVVAASERTQAADAVPPPLTFSAGEPARQDVAPVAVAGGEAVAAAQAGIDADGVRAYRIELARGARAHKRYPSLARERGWSGTAEVRIDVSGEGRPRRVALARSSGHDLLDREAVDMLARAAADTAVPDALRGQTFAVRLPVVFDLEEHR
jgi:protein TonB